VQPFSYVKAATPDAARAAGRVPAARYVAGGTALVDLMRLGVETPETLVDIRALGWSQIEETADGLSIGALARNSDVAHHPHVRDHYPVLAAALSSGASPQLRNVATVGGNLLQRTRCNYFRDPNVLECNKRLPGSGCAAIGGCSRSFAVLGASSHCIATHPSDMCVALLVLDAVVHTQGDHGARAVPIADLHLAPEDHPEREHVLEPGELVTHVTLPRSGFAARSDYVKARDRNAYAFALASCAVALELDGSVIRAARVAFGGIATKPWRSSDAERVLVGATATPETFARAADRAITGARTTPDNAFKVELAKRTLIQALTRVTHDVRGLR
jgi:xanthine dehydrogenase YagS FAD-binding subunit